MKIHVLLLLTSVLALVVAPDVQETIYAGMNRGPLRREPDGNWKRMPFEPDGIVASVAVSPANREQVAIVDQRGNVFRSDNGGSDWNSVTAHRLDVGMTQKYIDIAQGRRTALKPDSRPCESATAMSREPRCGEQWDTVSCCVPASTVWTYASLTNPILHVARNTRTGMTP